MHDSGDKSWNSISTISRVFDWRPSAQATTNNQQATRATRLISFGSPLANFHFRVPDCEGLRVRRAVWQSLLCKIRRVSGRANEAHSAIPARMWPRQRWRWWPIASQEYLISCCNSNRVPSIIFNIYGSPSPCLLDSLRKLLPKCKICWEPWPLISNSPSTRPINRAG